MNKTGWIIFTTGVILLLGGLVAWTRISNPPIDLSGIENNSIIAASDQNGNIGDHVEGSTEDRIFLIEYGDFQCPSCGAANPNVETLMSEYGDKVTFIFRNFPLVTIHPNAKAAAAAAEAAGLQGAYWDMHNMLYDNQDDWNSLSSSKRTDVFTQYASTLGLDTDQFVSDMGGDQVTQKIRFDMALGNDLGVSATPTFYLNGTELDADVASAFVQGDLTSIKAAIDALAE